MVPLPSLSFAAGLALVATAASGVIAAPSLSFAAGLALVATAASGVIAAPSLSSQAPVSVNKTGASWIQFSNPKAADFHVNTTIPGIPFEVSESWAGNLPISGNANETRELYFWFWPSLVPQGQNDLIIWFNGGPGCSSLEGMLQENGPFLLPYNSTSAIVNEYSWTNISNVLWVEQPVGTGFSKGEPNVTDENGVASEFLGFLEQFFKVFSELKGVKLWITGESYAGSYVPYIANAIYQRDAASNQAAGFNLQGISINDPTFDNDYFQEELAVVEFAVAHQGTLLLNDSTISNLQAKAEKNGIANFVEKNLKFPPAGPILLPSQYDKNYSFWNDVNNAVMVANPCFNPYLINSYCPAPTDPLGFPGDAQTPSANNFLNNQAGFKEAIHADPNITWLECSIGNVFSGGVDTSKAPSETVLPFVISKSKRAMIQHGLLDFVIIPNGSALGIQNMTWAGQQGFQSAPSAAFNVNGRRQGTWHEERGLTWATVDNAGHMIPQDQGAASFKLTQYLVGQIPDLSSF